MVAQLNEYSKNQLNYTCKWVKFYCLLFEIQYLNEVVKNLSLTHSLSWNLECLFHF